MSETKQPVSNQDWKRILARVLGRSCPRCGEGPLFAGRFRLHERCSECDLVYRREAGAMTGQMYLSAVVTEFFAVGLVLGVFFLTDWGPALSIAVGVPLVILFSYWVLPKMISLWVAIEFMTDLSNREPWLQEHAGED
jgi:uncharacterized protein (DUF983 family)